MSPLQHILALRHSASNGAAGGQLSHLIQNRDIKNRKCFFVFLRIILIMVKKDPDLKVLPPQAETDERTPLLLADSSEVTNDQIPEVDESLESQAEQEQREHDVGTAPLAEEPPTKKLIVIMGSLWLSTFFAALDSTVVATLSGPITASLNSGTLFAWTASGYLIANAAFQPLSGKLTDIYGRRAGNPPL